MLLGVQEPRLSSVPDGDTARGDQAVDFAKFCGLTLYPWQESLLRDMCRTDPDTSLWSAREVAVVVARQNGKGEVLVARELAGIFLFGERLIYHTAHLMETALDAMQRLWDIISENPDLMSWWADDFMGEPEIMKSNGKEALHFPSGQSVVFRTRTKKTGRGRTIDLLIFDECYDLPTEVFAAMNSTTAAVENAQKVFISSPVNRWEHMHGAIFSAKRWSGIDGDSGLLFKEWSMPEDGDPMDPEVWRVANPSLVDHGPGVQLGEIEASAKSAAKSEELRNVFTVESLGAGRWVPRDSDDEERAYVIDPDRWRDAAASYPIQGVPACLGAAVAPAGEGVALVLAVRTDRGVHLSLGPVEEFDRQAVVAAVKATVDAVDPCAVVLDPKGPASTIIDPLEKAEIEPECLSWPKVVAATELLMALFAEGSLTHDADPRWVEAAEVAEFRPGTERGRAFKEVQPVVSVLVAAAFAAWGLTEFGIPDDPGDVKMTRRFVGHVESVSAAPVAAAASALAF